MRSLAISLTVVVVVMSGALLGGFVRSRLPKHHLDSDTRDIVKGGIGLLATLAALVLGLIIASAKNSFDAKSEEVQSAAVKILHLDSSLRELGTVGETARQQLLSTVRTRIDQIWGTHRGGQVALANLAQQPKLEELQAAIRAISPNDEAMKSAIAKALQATDDLVQIRTLIVADRGSAIIMPLLVLLVFWFTVIAMGLNLFASRNGTTLTFNALCALSIASAIFLILEMDQAFGGLIQVSDAPLRAALAQLAR
jgi:hypothetical protein